MESQYDKAAENIKGREVMMSIYRAETPDAFFLVACINLIFSSFFPIRIPHHVQPVFMPAKKPRSESEIRN
jgi:hypothetical protein